MSDYLYLEGHSGISGDMVVAALLDLGADRAKLEAALARLPLEGYHYSIERGHSYSVSGCDFRVCLSRCDAPSEGEYRPHSHGSRHLDDVFDILARAALPPGADEIARRIFRIVAEAEAEAHGCAVEEVHFHEVGAVDSIVDVVSAAVLYDDLGLSGCIVSGLTEGSGSVMCQHGELPVPVPAVANIARKYSIPLRPSHVRGEMVTPTGIAIAAALRTTDHLPGQYGILRSGIGLGKRDFGKANFLRAFVVRDLRAGSDAVWQVEANIDDSTPEELGYAMERLFAVGAKDVWFTPCWMKKNRPACLLSVLVGDGEREEVERTLLRHTSTIGLRRFAVERTCMDRRCVRVSLPEGDVTVKISTHGGITRCQPEYESLRALAEASGKSVRELGDRARCEAERLL